MVSMIMYSLDGKVVAKIIDNNWDLNPNNYFRRNFDKSALEVIDEYLIPIVQVECLDMNTFKIGGIFRSEREKTSKLYPQFPSIQEGSGVIAVMGVGPNNIMICGSGGIISRGVKQIRDTELENFIADAKKIIRPWFDYSNPKKLGIRAK